MAARSAAPPGGQGMVLEIAQIDVKPGMEPDFEKGVAEALALFRRAKGCEGVKLERSIEKPQRYRLMIQWATLENHPAVFCGSEDSARWRGLLSHCFAGAPEVEH
eukprot:gene23450-24904_t